MSEKPDNMTSQFVAMQQKQSLTTVVICLDVLNKSVHFLNILFYFCLIFCIDFYIQLLNVTKTNYKKGLIIHWV